MYYDNDTESNKVKEYLKTKDRKLRDEIIINFQPVIKGTIFTNKLTRFGDSYEELHQVALEACIKALDKFNPDFITSKGEKVKFFSYISLVTKKSLIHYTTKNQKHRNTGDVEFASLFYKEAPKTINIDLHIEDLLSSIDKSLGYSRYVKMCLPHLQDYLRDRGEFDKRDFYKYTDSKNIRRDQARKFIKLIQNCKSRIKKRLVY